MKIANLRFGFATNSSSTHSIIYPKFDISRHGEKRGSRHEFGWNYFVLSTPEDKRDYFRTAAFEFYHRAGDKEEASVLASHFFPGGEITKNEYGYKGGIDHQSNLTFARPYLKNQTQKDLWGWIEKHIIQNHTINIIGGNDNSEPPEWATGHKEVDLPWATESGPSVFKIDPTGFITIFKNNGTKIRTTCPNSSAPISGAYPDLVDIKITDYCEKECNHCYQGSSKKGKHADFETIRNFVYDARWLGVFELAIGGGEPTVHPQFLKILKQVKTLGMVPNLSTQDAKRIYKGPSIRNAISNYCGSIAFSTQSPEEAKKWLKNTSDLGLENATLHYIIGLSPLENLYTYLDQTYHDRPTIILLGWKNSGRAGVAPHDTNDWWEAVKAFHKKRELWRMQLGVDTYLVDDVKEHLSEEVDPVLYGKDDGKFSFYFDAVTGMLGSHSDTEPTIKYERFKLKDWEPYPAFLLV